MKITIDHHVTKRIVQRMGMPMSAVVRDLSGAMWMPTKGGRKYFGRVGTYIIRGNAFVTAWKNI